jgi:hypothetical protein
MMTAEPMVARGAHYTALLDMIDHRGPPNCRPGSGSNCDVLLFGEPDRELTVRSAEVLIEALESSQRWSVESCDQLREHLYGCGRFDRSIVGTERTGRRASNEGWPCPVRGEARAGLSVCCVRGDRVSGWAAIMRGVLERAPAHQVGRQLARLGDRRSGHGRRDLAGRRGKRAGISSRRSQ